MDKDRDHLTVLAIFHYIVGVMGILGSCFFLLFLGMGFLMLVSPESVETQPEDVDAAAAMVAGWIMIFIGASCTLLGWVFSSLWIFAGRFLQQQKHHLFCMVIAAISTTFVPVGTVLGIFTLVVLLRPSVKALFEKNEPPPTSLVKAA